MRRALDNFLESINRVRNMHSVHAHYSKNIAPIIDLSDVLRAEIVLIISSLDYFVHEITRAGMLEIWSGARPTTPAYLRFPVSLDCLARSLADSARSDILLEEEIRIRHGFQTFQQPDRIADAIRLFSQVDLWRTLASSSNLPVQHLKSQLQLIVDRRNKIAHEADIDPSFPNQRWPISPVDVEHAINFIELLGIHIFKAACLSEISRSS